MTWAVSWGVELAAASSAQLSSRASDERANLGRVARGPARTSWAAASMTWAAPRRQVGLKRGSARVRQSPIITGSYRGKISRRLGVVGPRAGPGEATAASANVADGAVNALWQLAGDRRNKRGGSANIVARNHFMH